MVRINSYLAIVKQHSGIQLENVADIKRNSKADEIGSVSDLSYDHLQLVNSGGVFQHYSKA